MGVRVTKADMAAAKVDVRQWGELCSSFNFRISVPSGAEELLISVFAHLSARKTTNSLAGRLRHMDMADELVQAWMHTCKVNRCMPQLSDDARYMLVGNLIDPIARTGMPPGRMPRFLGKLCNGAIAVYGLDGDDPGEDCEN